MSEPIPIPIRTRLTSALDDVEDLARAKGLEDTFAVELFSLRRNIEEAVDLDDAELAANALRDARVLWGVLRGTAGRYAGIRAIA